MVLLALIAAGEAVFFLRFVLARVFRRTLLDVFGTTNLKLDTVGIDIVTCNTSAP